MDFLQLLIDSVDDDGKEFPPDVIANRMAGIIFAAYDTTATALSNLILELASPSALSFKQKVQKEVDDLANDINHDSDDTNNSTKPTLNQEVLGQKMKFAKACFYESIRRNRHVFGAPLRMVVNEDFYVPMGPGRKNDDGDDITEVTVIPKGYILSYNTTLANYDPTYFDAPHRFDPETNQNNNQDGTCKEGVAKQTIVFGLGKHECPGRFFALEEIMTALVVIFQHLDVSADSDFVPHTKRGTVVSNNPLPVQITLKESGETLFCHLRGSI